MTKADCFFWKAALLPVSFIADLLGRTHDVPRPFTAPAHD